ncbi:hypothetical protein NDU88_000680 [Pleurodeles waltl]|uniref:Uncharacterized protein n=1 Tax=Pleurodeles waltl TaxID=8319 RepID=A0AAV7MIC9_PLEWA|nr:hypothetical protein NDU88_000680 [Pleurodeles waltl]
MGPRTPLVQRSYVTSCLKYHSYNKNVVYKARRSFLQPRLSYNKQIYWLLTWSPVTPRTDSRSGLSPAGLFGYLCIILSDSPEAPSSEAHSTPRIREGTKARAQPFMLPLRSDEKRRPRAPVLSASGRSNLRGSLGAKEGG